MAKIQNTLKSNKNTIKGKGAIMYINPFVAGVAATLFSEAVIFFICMIVAVHRNK